MTRRWAIYACLFVLIQFALTFYADRSIALYMHDLDVEHQTLIDLFRALTDLGLSKWYLYPAAVVIVACALAVRIPQFTARTRVSIAKFGHNIGFLFASIALSGLITNVIKIVVGRARPVLLMRDNFYGMHPWSLDNNWKSWPSGHSTTAVALMTVLFVLFPRLRWLWIFCAVTLMLSRVMVNAHFVSDTLAGAVVGGLTTIWLARQRDASGKFPRLKGIFPIDRA